MLTADIITSRLLLSCLGQEQVTEDYLAWMSDEVVTRYLESRSAASLDSLRSYVATMRDSPDSYLFGMFSRASGEHYGNIKLGPVSQLHRSGAIGLIIGNKNAWGKGFASEAIAALSEWAFDDLGLEKLWAGSYQRNLGSIGAFKKCGYSVEGIQRSQVELADGSRDDVVLLGCTRNDHTSTAS